MNKNLIIGILAVLVIVLGSLLLKADSGSQGASATGYKDAASYDASIDKIKEVLTEAGAKVPEVFYPGGTFEDAANFAKTVGIPVYNSIAEALEAQNNSDPVNREVACDWIVDGQVVAHSGNAPYNTGVTNLGGGVWRHCYWAGSM